jgi:hypothetical protein
MGIPLHHNVGASRGLILLTGYPMAKNLRAKIPETDELLICDTNSAATDSFLKEMDSTRVKVTQNPRQVAEKSVSEIAASFYFRMMSNCSIDDLSWGLLLWLSLV